MLGAFGGHCQVLITNDKGLKREATRLIHENKVGKRLSIMTVAEVDVRFFRRSAK